MGGSIYDFIYSVICSITYFYTFVKSYITYNTICCELLSNYLILTYWNSEIMFQEALSQVVNCFQTI